MKPKADLITKPGIDETDSSFRFRVRDPGDFVRFRTIQFKASHPKIQAVVGPLKGGDDRGKVKLQSLIFPKDEGWDRGKVSAWVKAHPDVGKTGSDAEGWAALVDSLTVREVSDAEVEELEEADAFEQEVLYALLQEPREGTRSLQGVVVKAKDDDEEEFSREVVISSSALDRDREVVEPEGMTLPRPRRIPLVAGHAYGDLKKQIGDVGTPRVDGDKIVANPKWYVGMGNPEADWAWTLAKMGVTAFSIGFRPIKWEDADISDEKVLDQVRDGKMPIRTYKKWELMEVSQVILPSNREAVQRIAELGIIPKEHVSALLERVDPAKELSDKAKATLERATEKYHELETLLEEEKGDDDLPEVTDDAKETETEAKTEQEEDVLKLLEEVSEKEDEGAEETKTERGAETPKRRKVLIDSAEVELWVAEGEDKLLLAYRGPTQGLFDRLSSATASVKVTIESDEFVRKLEGWKGNLSKEIGEMFDRALARAGEKMALPVDSAAFVTVKDLIDAVIGGVSDLIDQRIAKAQGNVDEWLR